MHTVTHMVNLYIMLLIITAYNTHQWDDNLLFGYCEYYCSHTKFCYYTVLSVVNLMFFPKKYSTKCEINCMSNVICTWLDVLCPISGRPIEIGKLNDLAEV